MNVNMVIRRLVMLVSVWRLTTTAESRSRKGARTMQKCDPRAIARCPDKQMCGDHVFADGSGCDKFNRQVCEKPATRADRIPGATDVDKAAHRVFLAAADKEGIRWMPSGVKCKMCGGELDTYYCEERLYMVRCRKCETVMLLKSRGPGLAAIQFDRISREEAADR